jgi:hypothetical protein
MRQVIAWSLSWANVFSCSSSSIQLNAVADDAVSDLHKAMPSIDRATASFDRRSIETSSGSGDLLSDDRSSPNIASAERASFAWPASHAW